MVGWVVGDPIDGAIGRLWVWFLTTKVAKDAKVVGGFGGFLCGLSARWWPFAWCCRWGNGGLSCGGSNRRSDWSTMGVVFDHESCERLESGGERVFRLVDASGGCSLASRFLRLAARYFFPSRSSW